MRREPEGAEVGGGEGAEPAGVDRLLQMLRRDVLPLLLDSNRRLALFALHRAGWSVLEMGGGKSFETVVS